jgi:hypothetical protein
MSNNKKKIRIPAGLSFLASSMLTPDAPTSEGLKESVFGLVLNDDDGVNEKVVGALVSAYAELLLDEIEREDSDDEIEFVGDEGYAAEKLYQKYCIAGWRAAVKREYPEAEASRDDESVYEGCPWYEFSGVTWPAQLLAEVAYVLGYKEGRRGVAMSRYFEEHRKNLPRGE